VGHILRPAKKLEHSEHPAKTESGKTNCSVQAVGRRHRRPGERTPATGFASTFPEVPWPKPQKRAQSESLPLPELWWEMLKKLEAAAVMARFSARGHRKAIYAGP